jgi:hypothetical protein
VVRATRRERVRRRILVGVPVTLAAAVLGLLVVAEVADQITGCGSVDPTDEANYSTVAILNDTSSAVIIDGCPGDYCDMSQLPARVAPGQRFKGDAACSASGPDMTSWRVTNIGGKVLGYIAVDTPRDHDGLVFRVSHASHDRRTPTPPG